MARVTHTRPPEPLDAPAPAERRTQRPARDEAGRTFVAESQPSSAPAGFDFASVPVLGGVEGVANRSSQQPLVNDALRAAASPIDPAQRAPFELEFAADFSAVRVHTDASADAAARSLHAIAFTSGNDIVFRSGQYAPASAAGRSLIAHELSHVLQQRAAGTGALQRKPDAGPAQPGTASWFSVAVDRKLGSDELLVQFVKQYRGLAGNPEAEKVRRDEHWKWTGTPPIVRDADVKRGYVLLHVQDLGLAAPSAAERRGLDRYFGNLPQQERAALNAEVDREFWEKTHYKVGRQLGASADDRALATYWRALQTELMRKRKAVDALPRRIREFIFSESAVRSLQPRDYAAVLRIAGKLAGLSDDDLADYKSKVVAETTDLGAFESSIDAFVAERTRRQQAAVEREQVKTRLYGLETVYRDLKAYRSLQGSSRSIPAVDEYGVPDPTREIVEDEAHRIELELVSLLPRFGFSGIADFEAAIAAYEKAFRSETVEIGLDLLARYEHVLHVEEAKYRDAKKVEALTAALGNTAARKYYEEAAGHEATARAFRPDPELHRYMPGELEIKLEEERQGSAARALAEAEVGKLFKEQPLLANRDFNREQLAKASSTDEAQRQLLDYIADRRKDIAETRNNLAGDPGLIYKLDDLLKASYQQQAISPGSIYDLIVQDRAREVHVREAIVAIALAVLAIAAGLVTFGGGTIAVIGATTAFGISAYQAVQEFRQYEIKSAGAGAKLLSDDPSFAWVVVALVGAGLDLASVAGTLKALRPAVEAFNATGDVAQLEKDLKALSNLDAAVRANLAKALRAQEEFQNALRGLRTGSGGLKMMVVPLADRFGQLVVVAYTLAKRAVVSFEGFLLQLKAERIIAGLDLPPEDLQLLKRAFAEGLEKSRTGLIEYAALSQKIRAVYAAEEVEQIAMRGRALGLDERQITDFLEMGAIAKPGKGKAPLTAQQLLDQMENWVKVVKPRGYPYLFKNAEAFEAFKGEVRSLVRKYGIPEGEIAVQGSALRTPAAKDVDVAIFLSDEQFARYAERCKAGLRARVKSPATLESMLGELQGKIDEGFIPKFFIDRPAPGARFESDVFGSLATPFGLGDVDVSVMKASSKYALYPSLGL